MNSISMPAVNAVGHVDHMHGISNMSILPATYSALPAIDSITPIHRSKDLHDNSASLFPSPIPPHESAHRLTSGLLAGAVDKRRKPRNTSRISNAVSFMADDGVPPLMLSGSHSSTSMDVTTTTAVAAAVVAAAGVTSLQGATSVYEADGIQFKMLSQLPSTKIQRLRSEKIKPIEELTFNDIKAYNRNQLRAYCSVYGIRRKKKADMECDMARYAALFHPHDPNYDISKFKPTEYASGPIPRRKVPVTKEQKERAAGDFKQLTNALHQRPNSVTSSGIVSGSTGGLVATGFGSTGCTTGHSGRSMGRDVSMHGHAVAGPSNGQGLFPPRGLMHHHDGNGQHMPTEMFFRGHGGHQRAMLGQGHRRDGTMEGSNRGGGHGDALTMGDVDHVAGRRGRENGGQGGRSVGNGGVGTGGGLDLMGNAGVGTGDGDGGAESVSARDLNVSSQPHLLSLSQMIGDE